MKIIAEKTLDTGTTVYIRYDPLHRSYILEDDESGEYSEYDTEEEAREDFDAIVDAEAFFKAIDEM